MSATDLLPALAAVLLGDAPIGQADRNWLRLRLEHGDWLPQDSVLVVEMLPAPLRSLLGGLDNA